MLAHQKEEQSTPICRCRVLYLGSSVPHLTKDGLQAIQEPLQELYPEDGSRSVHGIDSWLSIWSNGLLLENLDENQEEIIRFFPIEALHYCAAVRYVAVNSSKGAARFLPLDSPFARGPNSIHSPLFACVLRRTTGIKVLECHAFLCRKESSAHALVRCCFHAYADNAYARQLEDAPYNGFDTDSTCSKNKWKNVRTEVINESTVCLHENGATTADELTVYDGDENHKVWAGRDRGGSSRGDKSYSRTRSRARQIIPDVASSSPPPPVPSNSVGSGSLKPSKQKKLRDGRGNPPKECGDSLTARKYPRSVNGTVASLHKPKVSNGFPPQRNVNNASVMNGHILHGIFMPSMYPNYSDLVAKGSAYPVPRPMHFPPMLLPPKSPYGWMPPPEENPYFTSASRSMTPVYPSVPEDYYFQYATASHWKSAKDSRKKADQVPCCDESATGNGIYKKKGHLNERAFSYSIRQEHHSRSYGSAGNLSPNGDISGHLANKDDITKMVQHLDISNDTLSRPKQKNEKKKKLRS